MKKIQVKSSEIISITIDSYQHDLNKQEALQLYNDLKKLLNIDEVYLKNPSWLPYMPQIVYENTNKYSKASNCMHDNCPECNGSGVKKTGGACIHSISCPCPKCTPTNIVA